MNAFARWSALEKPTSSAVASGNIPVRGQHDLIGYLSGRAPDLDLPFNLYLAVVDADRFDVRIEVVVQMPGQGGRSAPSFGRSKVFEPFAAAAKAVISRDSCPLHMAGLVLGDSG